MLQPFATSALNVPSFSNGHSHGLTFPPTLHKALAHGWELVQRNQGKGLGCFSESGLEALNKWIRYYNDHGSRKDSTEHQMEDKFNHLWQGSSPLLSVYDRIRRKRTKAVIVPDEIDSIVQSLFIGDSEVDTESAAGTVRDADNMDYNQDVLLALRDQLLQPIEESEDVDEPAANQEH